MDAGSSPESVPSLLALKETLEFFADSEAEERFAAIWLHTASFRDVR